MEDEDWRTPYRRFDVDVGFVAVMGSASEISRAQKYAFIHSYTLNKLENK